MNTATISFKANSSKSIVGLTQNRAEAKVLTELLQTFIDVTY